MKPIQVRISEKLHQDLKDFSKETGMKLYALVEILLNEALKRAKENRGNIIKNGIL